MKKQLSGQLMLTIMGTILFDVPITLTKDNCDHLESLDSYIFKADEGFYFNEKVIQKPISISCIDEDGTCYITQLLKRLDDSTFLSSSPINDTLDRLQLEVVTDLDEDDNPIGYHIEIVIVPNNLTNGVKDVIRDNSYSIIASLTHSFNELDDTLKALVESAIETGQGVACTEPQWNSIKLLLNKSLYFNYGGISMIKTYSDGMYNYVFGGNDLANSNGYTLSVQYDVTDNLINVVFAEI